MKWIFTRVSSVNFIVCIQLKTHQNNVRRRWWNVMLNKNNFENWKHWSFKKCTWKNEKTRNHHLHFISSEQIIYPHARLTRTCPQVHVILKCSMLSIFIVFYIRITSWYNSFNIYGIMGRIGIYFVRNLPNDWFFLYCKLSCFKTFLMEIDCAIYFFKNLLKKINVPKSPNNYLQI